MSKQRYVNTKFWSDGFIVALNPLDRYLFLYLLTNEHTNICGIYELPWRVMARETGLDEEMLQKMFKRLEDKICYIDGWIYIKNFAKHQRLNPKVQKGIDRTIKETPNEITQQIKKIDIDYDRLSKSTNYSNLNLNLNLNSNLNNNKRKTPTGGDKSPDTDDSLGLQVNTVLGVFHKTNGSLKFGNKTQRKAVEGLIEIHGFPKTKKYAEKAVAVQSKLYAPIITTPLELRDKWTKLMVFQTRENQRGGKIISG